MSETTVEHRNIEPVDSFKEAAPLLRRPFTANAVKFKVQAAYPRENPTGALIVAYIDARLVAERLNLVCPHLWYDEYEQLPGDRMMCRLTIDGITRPDIGEGYQGKGLYSDALKRAAVKFGVGVSLYAVPAIQLTVGAGDLRQTSAGQKKSCALTVKGENACRYRYRQWLADVGIAQFGEPLDHGDAEGSVGDVESEASVPDDSGSGIGKEIAKKIVDRVWSIPAAKKSLQLAASHAAGTDVGDCATKAKAVEALAALEFGQAEKLDRWIAKKESGEVKGGDDGE